MIMVRGTVEVVLKMKPEYNGNGYGYTLIGRYTGGSITATTVTPTTGVGSCLTFQAGKFVRNIRLSIDGNPKNWNENRWQYHWEGTIKEDEKIYASFGRSAKPFEYHNGSCWPYWAGMYAYALKMYGMDYEYALTRWFTFNIEKNNFTPIEYYSPYCADGALLQAWSSTAAFVYYDVNCDFFNDKI